MRGPYDGIFLDADHSYDAGKLDFELYAPMGKIIALHDIANPAYGVTKFWGELRGTYKHLEVFQSGFGMGIGVIFK